MLLYPFKRRMLLQGTCCIRNQNHVYIAFGFLGRGYCHRVSASWASWLSTSICWWKDLSIWRLPRPGCLYIHHIFFWQVWHQVHYLFYQFWSTYKLYRKNTEYSWLYMGNLTHITMERPCADMDPFGVARILQQQCPSDGTGLGNSHILNIYLIMFWLLHPKAQSDAFWVHTQEFIDQKNI